MIFDPLYELLNNKKCIVLNKSIEIKKKLKAEVLLDLNLLTV